MSKALDKVQIRLFHLKENMKKTIQEILQKELNEKIYSIREIYGLGAVNRVYAIKGGCDEYILRLNENPNKKLEYRKEQWCLEKATYLGIPSPKVLKIGFHNNVAFMIQNKISGINGKYCNSVVKEYIWKNLGTYAARYHQLRRIEEQEVEEQEFHKNWKARLEYNLHELNDTDSLLKKKIMNHKEQKNAKEALSSLKEMAFNVGLVHGDLCPRNTIFAKDIVYLLDWGTAEINVVPHNEIGIALMSNEANEREFHLFLEGLGISASVYKKIKEEIDILNFLHRLDKYRWAEDHQVENIKEYGKKVKDTFNEIIN